MATWTQALQSHHTCSDELRGTGSKGQEACCKPLIPFPLRTPFYPGNVSVTLGI